MRLTGSYIIINLSIDSFLFPSCQPRQEGGRTIESLKRELAARGVRSSYQRLRVLQYLRAVGGHPTADEIHRGLLAEMPTLAKATVYNTLHALVAAGLAHIVDTGDAEARYDAVVTGHGHFRCEVCGRLSDFAIDIDNIAVDGLARYRIHSRSVVFQGICPTCLARSQSNQE
jgi:Fur family transcriptional regulator, peroxide stress response regulator